MAIQSSPCLTRLYEAHLRKLELIYSNSRRQEEEVLKEVEKRKKAVDAMNHSRLLEKNFQQKKLMMENQKHHERLNEIRLGKYVALHGYIRNPNLSLKRPRTTVGPNLDFLRWGFGVTRVQMTIRTNMSIGASWSSLVSIPRTKSSMTGLDMLVRWFQLDRLKSTLEPSPTHNRF